MDNTQKLKRYETKLAEVMPIFLEKKRLFRGIKHEDSLSELRYTEYMVYKELVDNLKIQILELKKKIRSEPIV